MKEKNTGSSLYRKVRRTVSARLPWLKRIRRPRHVLKEVIEKQDELEKQLKEYKNQLEAQNESLRRMAEQDDVTAGRIRRIEAIDPSFASGIVDRICQSNKMLKLLNRHLSVVPTIWGDASRLDIAPSASVFTCFFNVNSGRISIGEHTFAGSGVSLLAGSHDVELKGFLRRDAEITEGCDIKIGNGVWLASNSTLLGPCTVGDNAVIAAGAVVIPGTNVPENTIYGGIPARKIADLKFSDRNIAEDPAVQKALDRYSGVLFLDGWKPKTPFSVSPTILFHTMIGKGKLLLSRQRWTMHYILKGNRKCRIELSGPDGKTFLTLTGTDGKTDVVFPCDDRKVEQVSIQVLTEFAELSIALTAPETADA